MRREAKVWPKTKALMEAMREASCMRREGVSADDVAKGLESFLRELLPQRHSLDTPCVRCGAIGPDRPIGGYELVTIRGELYGDGVDGPVRVARLCTCSKGQALRDAQMAAKAERSDRPVKKKAENWGR